MVAELTDETTDRDRADRARAAVAIRGRVAAERRAPARRPVGLRCSRLWCALLAAVVSGPGAAAAQDDPKPPSSAAANTPYDPSERPLLPPEGAPVSALGMRLAEEGLFFRVDALAEAAGNPIGGARQGFSVSPYIVGGVDLDLAPLIGWRGGLVHASVIAEHSSGLSTRYIGNFIDAQSNYAPFDLVRFLNLTVQQRLSVLHHDDVDVIAGRTGALPLFAQNRYSCFFMNHAFCGALYGFTQSTGVTVSPLASWGGRIKFTVPTGYYGQFGIFAVDPGAYRKQTHLFDFGTRYVTGLNFLGEVGFGRPAAKGRNTRSVRFGASVVDAPRDDVLLRVAGKPVQHRGEVAVYGIGDEVLWHSATSPARSLGVFQSVYWNLRDSEAVAWVAKGGVVLSVPFKGRDEDKVGFAVFDVAATRKEITYLDNVQRAAGGLGNVRRHEAVLELNYGYMLYPGLLLQPNIQYIINPDFRNALGRPNNSPDVLVVGLQVNFSLERMLGFPRVAP